MALASQYEPSSALASLMGNRLPATRVCEASPTKHPSHPLHGIAKDSNRSLDLQAGANTDAARWAAFLGQSQFVTKEAYLMQHRWLYPACSL